MNKSGKKLTIHSLSKTFKNSTSLNVSVLKNIDLYVNEGELVALIGPSGCGKTTLLDCIAGLAAYDSGVILVSDDKVVQGKHLVSYMMQEDGLLPWRHVIDNVMLPLEIKGVNKNNAKKQALPLLQQFELSGFEKHYPGELSGGMRQRVALARTYLVGRNVMLMDEPFSRLDALTKTALELWFLDIWQKNRKTVLFVTHDIDEAILLADRIYVLSTRPGRVIAEYRVSIPRPREFDASTTFQFIALKKKLLQALRSI